MIYLIIFGLSAALLILYLTAPKEHAAVASRADKKKAWSPATRRNVFRGPIRDEKGEVFDTAGKLVGYVVGDSLPDVLPNGSMWVASYLNSDEEKRCLQPGDIVVVDAPAKDANIQKRLRVIDKVHDDHVTFRPDPSGKPHNPRKFEFVIAKVEWSSGLARSDTAQAA